MPWEKVPAFLKSTRAAKTPENNHFRVPTLANNRFAFEKFLPPPSLLYPTT